MCGGLVQDGEDDMTEDQRYESVDSVYMVLYIDGYN